MNARQSQCGGFSAPRRGAGSAALIITLLLVFASLVGAGGLDQLVAEHFQVRVAIGDPRETVSLRAEGPCLLLNRWGEIIHHVPDGTVLTIDTPDEGLPPATWRVVLGDYSPTGKSWARALAARVGEAVNHPARLVTVPDSDRILVTLGHFDSRDGAADVLERVESLTRESHLWHDDSQTDTRMIRIRGLGDDLEWQWAEVALMPARSESRVVVLRASVSDRTYRGDMICRGTADGNIQAINRVNVENYLASVVAAEMGRAPDTALRAQAIAARSEALHKVDTLHHRSVDYDLCDTAHCQMYRGAGVTTEASRRAVEATRGWVLMNGEEVCDAVYSHSAGGVTANVEDVWWSDPSPYLRSRLDVIPAQPPPDFSSEVAIRDFIINPPAVMSNPEGNSAFPSYARPNFRWRVRFTGEGLRRQLGDDLGTIREVSVSERATSGHVVRLTIEGTEGERTLERSGQIIGAFPDLKSTLFVVDQQHDENGNVEEVVFNGGGWGHGIGLCQMGALVRGQRGQSHEEILDAYFPLAELRRLY